MRRTVVRALTAATVTFALVAVGGPVASAAQGRSNSAARPVAEALVPQSGSGKTDTRPYALAPNGDRFYFEEAPSQEPGTITPYVEAIDRFMCSLVGNENHMVNSWDMNYVIHGQVRLNCGTAATSGYNHIQDRHADDWIWFLEGFGLYGANWDDFMEFVTGSVVQAPGYYSLQGNGKLCFTAPVIIYDSDGLDWTMNPSVIVSQNNKIVITSYPDSSC